MPKSYGIVSNANNCILQQNQPGWWCLRSCSWHCVSSSVTSCTQWCSCVLSQPQHRTSSASSKICECVSVCGGGGGYVCERVSVRVHVHLCERERACERECVWCVWEWMCMCVCVWERERECVYMCVREMGECICVCVYVWERMCCVWQHMSVWVTKCIYICHIKLLYVCVQCWPSGGGGVWHEDAEVCHVRHPKAVHDHHVHLLLLQVRLPYCLRNIPHWLLLHVNPRVQSEYIIRWIAYDTLAGQRRRRTVPPCEWSTLFRC